MEHIGYQLIIKDNQLLTTLSGLGNLRYLGDVLEIQNNDLLSNLVGLDRIMGMRVVTITDNNNLSICNMPSICSYLTNLPSNFSYWFNANASGCIGNTVKDQYICSNSLAITDNDGIYFAADSIGVSGDVSIGSFARYSAPNTHIFPIFEVSSGGVLEILIDGCTSE